METQQPKILIIDIETAPVLGSVWGLWQQNLSLDMIVDDWFIMSFAAKWYGEEDIIYRDCRNTYEDDKVLLADIHLLLTEADFVVAHNGDKFDIKKINARFIKNGFPPPAPYRTIDTLKMAKKTFAFTSNKLEYLTGELCKTKKLSHGKYPGFKLWKECLAGNEEAWEEMKQYNLVDVISLEELYDVLKAWHPTHPNMYTYTENESFACPKCGGTHVHKRGYYYTNKGKYQRYVCLDCHGWSSETTTSNTTTKRKSLLASR